jgi:hypothetical protein
MVRAHATRLSPRIGRSLALSRPLVGLYRLVRVPFGDVPSRRHQILEQARVHSRSVGHDLDRNRTQAQRMAEESSCGRRVAAG